MVTDAMVEAARAALHNGKGLRAALEAAERAAWQPIETAPRGDGKMSGPDILLTDGENVGSGYWFPGNRNPEGAGWADWDWTGEPTHWRPLPAPPAAEKSE